MGFASKEGQPWYAIDSVTPTRPARSVAGGWAWILAWSSATGRPRWAAEDVEKTPQDVLEILESRRNQAGRAVPIQPAPKKNEFENLFEEILELIREGGMGRIAGATFIFLLTALLARIPILLIRVGVQLLAASAKVKVPTVN